MPSGIEHTTRPVGGALATYVPRLLLSGRGRRGPEHWELEGSLVFADISGFTRLTERLARQGRVGAEEMVTTISAVFTELLSATDDGGDVLKFGGDALLILYTGDEHAVRSCHAAQGMQRTLRRVGSIASSQGRVRLRMSVGIHSGTFPMFLVGEPDALELLIVGGPASTTVDMESAADAGEILVSAATAAQLDPRWLGAPKAGGVLLGRVPSLPPLPAPDHRAPEAELERFVPRLLRGRLGSGSMENEHRRIAVSFVHFGGIDDLVRARGMAEAFDRVNALAVEVQSAVDDHGVLLVCTDIGGDGGKFMLASGAPDASEDDAGRLLRAAHRIVTADVGIPVRVGANHGHVFAGDVGAPFRRTYSTMGDAVNLAARVMGKARFGHVLATRAAVAAAASRFHAAPVAPFMVKGKSHPVEALLVGEPLGPAPPRLLGSELPLVGRDDELARLDAAVATARAGQGVTVELVGEVGAGKSRLLAELAARHPDLPMIAVAGDPYGHAVPYHVAGSLLRRLLRMPTGTEPTEAGRRLSEVVHGTVPSLVPWLPLLALPVGAQVESTPEVDAMADRFRPQRLRTAVADLVAAITPAAIVAIDAVEHVDDASADLVGHVLAQVTDRGWTLVLSRRSDQPRSDWWDLEDLVEIPVPPLARPDAEALVVAMAERHPVPAHLVEPILNRGRGNPLFLLELVRATAASPATSAAALPTSIESIVASGLDSLDPDDRQALRHLSVLGPEAPCMLVDLALADLGVRSSDAALWSRVASFVSRSDTTIAFHGDLARQVAYEGLTFRRRREVHGRVADVLLADAPDGRAGGLERDALTLVAWHLEQAARWEQAWPAAVAAGDRARAAHANTEAADAYRRALGAAQHLPDLAPHELADVAERCGDTCEVAGLYDQASQSYAVARRVATDPVRTLRLLRKQGVIEERIGRYTSALRWYGRALRVAADLRAEGVHTCVAELHNAYAGVRYRQGRLRDCVREARAAADVARAHGDLTNLAHAYYLLDAAYTDLGEGAAAAAYRHESLPIFERTGDLIGQANVLNNLGIDAFFAGDLTAAEELYQRSRTARLIAGDVVGAATADNNIAEILIDQGRLDEAEDLLRSALRVWRGARYPVGVALATSNLGLVAARRGEVDHGRSLVEEALQLFESLGSTSLAQDTAARLAVLVDDTVTAG